MERANQELIEMQQPRHRNYELSATFSASLTMENDGRLVSQVNAARGIDGLISVQQMERIFKQSSIEIDEWAKGKVDFAVLAKNFNDDVEPPTFSDVVIDSLKTISISGNKATLTVTLARADYTKVNAILEALGGKWSTSAKTHVFADCDPEEVIADFLATGRIEKHEDFGFFVTQPELAKRAFQVSGISPGDEVLEPEAGTGNLAMLAAQVVGLENVTCYEIQQKNCEILRSKGFQVEKADFLQVPPKQKFTAVMMNPPFAKQADIDHVLHAYKFLVPGGRLTAIMSIGVTFRSNRKAVEFRKFLETHDAMVEENPADAFKASGTMARTVLVSLQKPAVDGEEKSHAIVCLVPTEQVQETSVQETQSCFEF